MALYAFDGTGNEDEDNDTNVLEFFRAYDDPLKNDDSGLEHGSLYLKGIGTLANTLVGEGVAEAFGIGGHDRVKQAIRRLRNNLAAGDTDVDVVGFSRGAAIAVSFANRVACDLPEPVSIRFIGVWDIVGQFGAPGEHLNAGHDLRMPGHCTHCYHAMALDETRAFFPLTRLARAKAARDARLVEAWFRGAHSDVGGGNGNRGLNWIALHWMYESARRHGLPIRQEAVAANLAHRDVPRRVSRHKLDLEIERRIDDADLLHASVELVEVDAGGRRIRNPRRPLARIADDGTITTV